MRAILDEPLSPQIAVLLGQAGHDVDAVDAIEAASLSPAYKNEIPDCHLLMNGRVRARPWVWLLAIQGKMAVES